MFTNSKRIFALILCLTILTGLLSACGRWQAINNRSPAETNALPNDTDDLLIEADTWYTSRAIPELNVYNCVLDSAPTALRHGITVIYYPVCRNCHKQADSYGYPHWKSVSSKTPVEEYYICDDCGATTVVRLKVE